MREDIDRVANVDIESEIQKLVDTRKLETTGLTSYENITEWSSQAYKILGRQLSAFY